MERLFIAFSFLAGLVCNSVHANPIDDNCPKLTYKHAPAATADQYICHKEYAVALSYKTRNPIYTTEYLSASHIGNLPRTNDFKADPEVPVEYAVQPTEYVHTICHGERCDRGHMTPDKDFSSCAVCIHESFYMSNMVPQNKGNNEQIWKHLEMDIRSYVVQHGPVYVITGPVYGNNPDHIGNGIAVPDGLFKVAIDSKTGKSTAFMMLNEDIPTDTLPEREVKLADVEAAAGITFDNSLDKQTIGALDIFH